MAKDWICFWCNWINSKNWIWRKTLWLCF